METRNLVALGMALGFCTLAMMTGNLPDPGPKDIAFMLFGGLLGFSVPRGKSSASAVAIAEPSEPAPKP